MVGWKIHPPRIPKHDLDLKNFAQVLLHEIQHCQGLSHREMMKWWKIEPEFHKGMEIKVKVEKIPSVGYKVYQLRIIKHTNPVEFFQFKGNILETPYYSAKISRSGAINYLYDKKAKKN